MCELDVQIALKQECDGDLHAGSLEIVPVGSTH